MLRLCCLLVLTLSLSQLMAQPMVVGTYNLRYDNPRDSGNLWKDRAPYVAELIRFHDFDIIGTQEALQHQLDNLLQLLPNYTYYGIGRDDGKEKGEHSAIFFKKNIFNVLDAGDFWLSETPEKPAFGWDAKINRICSWVKLQHHLTGKQLYCFNVHFDHQGIVARNESSKLLLQKIKQIAHDQPVILMGDFNGDHQSSWYQLLANSGYLFDTYQQVEKPYLNNGTFQGFGPNLNKASVIDHVFLSSHFTARKWGVLTDTYQGKFPSDHFPVLAVIGDNQKQPLLK